jgi:hypothetical protein
MACEYSWTLFESLEQDLTGCRVVLLNYREDGVTPYVTVWKHGVKEMKV